MPSCKCAFIGKLGGFLFAEKEKVFKSMKNLCLGGGGGR
jgi:hypothetical protein